MTPLLAMAILVELFTSEGCSSCPPADAVLARLHREQPVAGVQLVVLSEHVDYWNDLGWKDPFSDVRYTDRQSLYGPRMYTPQVIVDGRTDVLGSDETGILKAARTAATQPHGTLRLTSDAGRIRIGASGLPPHSGARVLLAVVEDGLISRVERGENAGRTLTHTAVARDLREAGTVPASATHWTAEVPVSLNDSWKRARVIAFVQDAASGRILASAALQEQRDGASGQHDQRAADDEAHGAKDAHTPKTSK